MKALIKVGYGCNNHCTFCHTLDVRDIDGTSAEVEAKIDRAARLGHSMIVLSGGEVTMRPELLKWATRSAALGLEFGLVTNGRSLAYGALVDKLLERRLRYVYMSLHGGTAKVHNLLVRADAFEQTFEAVKNLAGRGLDFTVNTVVTRQNLHHLRPVVDALLPYPDVVLKFSMVQPKGGGDKHFDRLIPPVAAVAEKVVDAIEYGLARGNGRYAHDGIPFCLLPGHEDKYDDLKTHRFATMIEIGEPDFFPVDDRAKVQPAECDACSIRGACPGLYRGYAEVHGFDELRAVRGRPRSNSFNYVFERVVATVAERCPILADGTTPWDRGRHVFVRKGDKIARYRAESRDFTDVEIESTKHDLGQIYVDISSKPAPDDFARDLRKLRRSPQCRGCTAESTCAGMFEVVRDDVFTRDDARVRALLGDLRGDVLDLGCGEAPYCDVLAPLIASGEVRYVAVEPDAARASALRARLPLADVRVGTAEERSGLSGEFDHVLLLRSWNHLHDPERVLDAILPRLRPGGSIIVVDNVAFGLLRAKEQAERAESGPALFEHHRNDSAALAAARFSLRGLEPEEQREVSADTSNQWLLRYVLPKPTLTPDEIAHFVEHGFVRVRGAIARPVVDAWRDAALARMTAEARAGTLPFSPTPGSTPRDITRFDPDVPSTWPSGTVNLPSTHGVPLADLAPKLWGAICDLLGGAKRIATTELSDYFVVRFPDESAMEGDGWHLDDPSTAMTLRDLRHGVVALTLFSDVASDGGPTFLRPQTLGPVVRRMRENPGGVDFTDRALGPAIAEGCPELVRCDGAAGDAYLVHPLIIHRGSANLSDRLRWLSNRMIYLNEPLDPDGLSPVERAIGHCAAADESVKTGCITE